MTAERFKCSLRKNPIVEAARAVRVAWAERADESNIFLSQTEKMGVGLSRCEAQAQVLKFLGYPMKAFLDRFSRVKQQFQKMDDLAFEVFPKLLGYGSNCNIVFTK